MTLEELRAAIDGVDDRILALLRERAGLVMQVGALKSKTGEPYYAPEREESLLRRLVGKNTSALPPASIRAIYREILSAMRALEHTLEVAFLGPVSTFSHQAAVQHFGNSAQFSPERTIGEVFDAVERGRVPFGVVPVENSLEGSVSATLDRLMETEARICAQIFLPIELNLLGNTPLAEVRKVYSHPQPFGQCRRWLAEHLPGAECVEVSSTARAAELAAGEKGAAAIAGSLTAKELDLPVLAAAIQDATSNVTRFFVLGRRAAAPSGHDQTSIMFAVKDQPGALARALEPFEKSGISLTRIESRPSKRRPWEYYFFADLAGHADDPEVAKALGALAGVCAFTKVLGSYPAAAAA